MPKTFQFFIGSLLFGVAAYGCGSGHEDAPLSDVQATNRVKPEMTITVHSQAPQELPKSDTPPPVKHRPRHRRKQVEPPPTEPPVDTDVVPAPGGDIKPDPDDGGSKPPTDPLGGEPGPSDPGSPDPGKTGTPPDKSN